MIKKCKNIFSKIINAKLKPNDQTQDIANTSLQAPHAQNSTNAKKKARCNYITFTRGFGSYWSNLYVGLWTKLSP